MALEYWSQHSKAIFNEGYFIKKKLESRTNHIFYIIIANINK